MFIQLEPDALCSITNPGARRRNSKSVVPPSDAFNRLQKPEIRSEDGSFAACRKRLLESSFDPGRRWIEPPHGLSGRQHSMVIARVVRGQRIAAYGVHLPLSGSFRPASRIVAGGPAGATVPIGRSRDEVGCERGSKPNGRCRRFRRRASSCATIQRAYRSIE
jgi:hypothetical protein